MPGCLSMSSQGLFPRLLVLGGLWWLISGGRTDAWLIGLPAVVLAALASMQLGGRALPGVSLPGLGRFVLLFLLESVRGGIDVARRTLGPRLQVQPGFRRYHLRLHEPLARVLFINCVGLLPGTLAADLDGDTLDLHLLDVGAEAEPQLRRLETAIARLLRAPPRGDA